MKNKKGQKYRNKREFTVYMKDEQNMHNICINTSTEGVKSAQKMCRMCQKNHSMSLNTFSITDNNVIIQKQQSTQMDVALNETDCGDKVQ